MANLESLKTNRDNLSMKSEENFFKTIGEVSSELSIPPHVLRFWETKFFDIKPHKRKGGHRYYSKSDIEVIQQVKTLLYDKGFTIKGAKKFISEQKKNKNTIDNQQNLFGESKNPDKEKIASDNDNNQLEIDKNVTQSSNIQNLDVKKIEYFISELENIKKMLQC
jgi:DNA-binding transcriptional MerR regulator